MISLDWFSVTYIALIVASIVTLYLKRTKYTLTIASYMSLWVPIEYLLRYLDLYNLDNPAPPILIVMIYNIIFFTILSKVNELSKERLALSCITLLIAFNAIALNLYPALLMYTSEVSLVIGLILLIKGWHRGSAARANHAVAVDLHGSKNDNSAHINLVKKS